MQWCVRGARVRVCVCEREGRTGAGVEGCHSPWCAASQSHSPADPIPQACDRRSPTATREEARGAARMLRVYARRTAALGRRGRRECGGSRARVQWQPSRLAAEQACVRTAGPVFGRFRRTLGRRPSAGACWPPRIVATGAKLQRRARLQRWAKAEWAELSWARPMESGWAAGGPAAPRSRCFCGTRSARREVRLTGFGAPRVGPSAIDPRPARACESACGASVAGACQVASLRNLRRAPSSRVSEGWPVGDRPSAGAVRVACDASGDGRR